MRTTYTVSWESILAQALRGATTKSISGSSTFFTDAYSGMEVKITASGGFATGLSITGPVSGATQTLIDADFESGVVSQTSVVNAFTSYRIPAGSAPSWTTCWTI